MSDTRSCTCALRHPASPHGAARRAAVDGVTSSAHRVFSASVSAVNSTPCTASQAAPPQLPTRRLLHTLLSANGQRHRRPQRRPGMRLRSDATVNIRTAVEIVDGRPLMSLSSHRAVEKRPPQLPIVLPNPQCRLVNVEIVGGRPFTSLRSGPGFGTAPAPRFREAEFALKRPEARY